MALYYYKARITYGDTSYYLFKIIQNRGFNIESGRAVSVLSQWLPLLLIKCAAPLRAVMMAYSFNLALIYVCCFLCIRYWLKSYFLAWGALLCTHLNLHYGYYYPTEMIFSSAIIILIVAFLTCNDRQPERRMAGKRFWMVSILLLISILFIHPFYFVILGLTLLCVYCIYPQKHYLLFIALLFVLFLMKVTVWKSGYEAGKLAGFNVHVLSLKAIKVSYLTFFWKQSFSERLMFAKYLFFVFELLLLLNRRWMLALLLPFTYSFLYLLTYLSIPNGESLGYMECYMTATAVLPLSVFLVYAEKEWAAYRDSLTILFFLLSVLGFYRIKSEPLYKERVKYLAGILEEGRKRNAVKLFAEEKDLRPENILVGWALPFETLLLSSEKGLSQTLFMNTPGYQLDKINREHLFLGVPWEKPASDSILDPIYFKLRAQPYQKVKAL